MNTLKSLLLIATIAIFSSCQENEEPEITIEDQETGAPVVTTCSRANCGARIEIRSNTSIRWQIVQKAVTALRTRPGFNDLYNTNTHSWRVVHINGRKYNVYVPLVNSEFLQEF